MAVIGLDAMDTPRNSVKTAVRIDVRTSNWPRIHMHLATAIIVTVIR